GLGAECIDHVEHAGGDHLGLFAQVHAHQGGNLVVAGPSGPQFPAQLSSGAFDQTSFQGGVHVLVGLGRGEGTGGDVRLEGVQGGEHALEFGVAEQAGVVQHAGVRPRTGDVVV